MDVDKILQELREERALVEGAILYLEQLKYERRNRRGRPPVWLKQIRSVPDAQKPKPKRG